MTNTRPPDENLPEVVPSRPPVEDASPQVLSDEQAWQREALGGDKYPVVYDDAPKLFDDGTIKGQDEHELPQAWSPDASAGTAPWESLPPVAAAGAPGGSEAAEERRIWGVKRRVFVILAVLAGVILLAAIIGGAVGGSMANKSDKSVSGDASLQELPSVSSSSLTRPPTTSPSSSSSSPSTSPTSTSSPPSPSSTTTTLNNSTAPKGLAFQAFASPSYLGTATPIIQAEGFHDLNMSARSYVWLPDGTQCCLTFCADRTTATGWWCDPRYQTSSSAVFGRVYIWCGGNDGTKNETCS